MIFSNSALVWCGARGDPLVVLTRLKIFWVYYGVEVTRMDYYAYQLFVTREKLLYVDLNNCCVSTQMLSKAFRGS